MRRIVTVLLFLSVLTVPLIAEEQSVGTKFAVAIEDGDLDAVRALIERGAAVDTPISYGEHSITPLLKASWDGELEIVQYLIGKGANVNARATDTQETALMNAITNGHIGIVKALLAAKADVSLRNSYDFNPFTSAVAAGNQEIAGMLLDAGAKPDDGSSGLTPMAFAVSTGDTSMMRFLVSRGADVNHGAKEQEQTALISAILAAKVEAVKTLIELKANVNTKMKDGTTPLKLARKGDQTEIVALLEAAGAKP
ncbi:MAG TPA: ankyrin repeat domain-containing protein [Thermoanaerobaculia bacterium]|jgi:ankyrin repeat protein|nr:ankyrin repeat domain-containing protein [Thermoanaerobaculia bacterium]